MEENKTEQSIVGTLGYFLYAVRRYLALILIIIILCVSAGIGYSFIRKPNYTANAKVLVTVHLDGDWSTETNWIQNHIKTIVDFCDSGVVIDRANYYYMQWEKEKNDGSGMDIETFIKNPPAYRTNPEHTGINNFINPANVDTTFVDHTTSISPVFDVNYTDKTETDAQEKVLILIRAFTDEVKLKDETTSNTIYFTADVTLTNGGINSIEKDVSMVSILFLSGLIGIFLSVLVVYVLILLDNSIRSKEELEAVVGATMLACIRKNEGGNKNGK